MAIKAGSVTIEIYPAGHGDAALVRCIGDRSTFNILIDGGVRSTFPSHLEPRLRELRSQGERLDLVVVTHIDTDHIAGILELLKANGPSSKPNVIEIGEIWHNGYRHLELEGRNATESEKQKVLSQIPSLSAAESAEGKISIKEADALASLITKNGYRWNTSFDDRAALAGDHVSLHGIVEITILSPRREELKELGAVWKRGIMSKGVSREAVVCDDFEVAFELEMPLVSEPEPDAVELISAIDADTIPDPSSFREDRSPINASSIALLIECAGRSLLFLGDSWPSVIVAHLQQSATTASPARFDAMKVSHHGSRHNTSPELLEIVDPRTFIISTDGSKHGHPHLEAMLRMAGACRSGSTFVFNYQSSTADVLSRSPLRTQHAYDITVGNGATPVVLTFEPEAHDGQ